jgi:hypothetical protein
LIVNRFNENVESELDERRNTVSLIASLIATKVLIMRQERAFFHRWGFPRDRLPLDLIQAKISHQTTLYRQKGCHPCSIISRSVFCQLSSFL